ncbi:MAG TPA: methyltransferase domain-containing protein [Kofleriaceae bacterium]|nr:methyltransferase domain-containing protein [Kofleriaceae bacterium]
MKTDYAAHDARYRQLRDEGAPGWDTAEVYRERETELAWGLAALEAPGKRLLELGCGAGNAAAWFVERGFTVTGIDIAPTAIAWATERAIPNARFLVGDLVAEIPGEYDVIVDGHCLHCIIGPDRARMLANVHRALVPGGSFFVSTMCGEITSPELRACFDPVSRCQIVDGIARRYIGTADALIDELRSAGFEIAAMTIDLRKHDRDQDNLWAVARTSMP